MFHREVVGAFVDEWMDVDAFMVCLVAWYGCGQSLILYEYKEFTYGSYIHTDTLSVLIKRVYLLE